MCETLKKAIAMACAVPALTVCFFAMTEEGEVVARLRCAEGVSSSRHREISACVAKWRSLRDEHRYSAMQLAMGAFTSLAVAGLTAARLERRQRARDNGGGKVS